MAYTSITCSETGEAFQVSKWEAEFLDRLTIPLPTLSPQERHRRRFAHRNESKLYRSTCHHTGQPIISIYNPESPYCVFSQNAWWSDDWNPFDFGLPFDFSKPFFEQFTALQRTVPRIALLNSRSENSEFCHNTMENKNCYLIFGGDYVEDSMYSMGNDYCRDVVDVYRVRHSELVYDSIDCHECYNVLYSEYSRNCRDSSFLYDCQSCNHCICCAGLRQARYCIFNEQLSPDEYEKRVAEFDFSSWSAVQALRQQFDAFLTSQPRRFAFLNKTEHCTGNRIVEAKNCENCFDVKGPAEDLKDIIRTGPDIKDAVSSNNLGKAEIVYEVMSGVECYHCAFSLYPWNSSNVQYSDTVFSSSDLFGCISLRNAKNCIFNRSYSRHDYEQTRAKIISHMKETGEYGEFFPISSSPFAYNESAAQEFYPIDKETAHSRNWRWLEESKGAQHNTYTVPDRITDVKDDILGTTLICEESGQPFKVIQQELRFYRKMNLPIPRYCFDVRNAHRVARRGGVTLYERNCDQCRKTLASCYPSEVTFTVLCEDCYQNVVY